MKTICRLKTTIFFSFIYKYNRACDLYMRCAYYHNIYTFIHSLKYNILLETNIYLFEGNECDHRRIDSEPLPKMLKKQNQKRSQRKYIVKCEKEKKNTHTLTKLYFEMNGSVSAKGMGTLWQRHRGTKNKKLTKNRPNRSIWRIWIHYKPNVIVILRLCCFFFFLVGFFLKWALSAVENDLSHFQSEKF